MLNQNLLLTGDDGYNLTKSLRFRSSASAYLSRTPASAGNRKTFTWSGWVKKARVGTYNFGLIFCDTGSNSNKNEFSFLDTDKLFFEYISSGSSQSLTTTQVFRDPSAWYHIVLAVDTTQATSSNRVKIYVNGSQITAFDSANYPSQNADMWINSTNAHDIGRGNRNAGALYFDGYMTEINFIDGQALTPSSFGETSTSTGVWIPKKYTGTYGTNGFYLPFTDVATTSGSNAGLGKDFSGNGNYWTTNNISVTSGSTYDSMKDVPTLTDTDTANYCTLNPLIPVSTTTAINGNLGMSGYNAGGSMFGTVGVSSGKWYFEYIAYADAMGGISGTPNGGAFPGAASNAYTWDSNNATKYSNGSGASYGSATSNGDIVGVAFDLDTGSITFYKNNVSQGTAYTFTPSGSYFPAFRNGSSTNTSVNFGQRPFAYTPPTGFKALNTFNLPTLTIGATPATTANKYFDVKTYTGTGSSLNITGLGFQPDLVWIKIRNQAYDHTLVDAVRGTSKDLESSSTDAEQTRSTVTAFNSDGFTVGTDSQVNSNNNTFVAWNWDANGSGSTNTAGSITSTVSANTTAGFSIVTYTGSGAAGTVGHGLGVAPAMIITKNRTTAGNSWVVWHKGLSGAYSSTTGYIYLDQTAAAGTTTNFYDGTAMTSTTFRWFGGNINVNSTSNNYVAYCFAQIAGYSAFGSYTGSGLADGPFIYLGFRPAYLMIKRTDSADGWLLLDNKRNAYNPEDNYLFANVSDAEGQYPIMDFVANGFKIRSYGNSFNDIGTFIYMAFAESPFKYSLAR